MNNRSFVPGALNAVFPDEVGGTTLSSLKSGSGIARLLEFSNGYLDEVISITRTDPISGYSTESTLETSLNQSASTLAAQLSALDGVTAIASSQLQLYDFTSDGSGLPLNVLLNGVDLASDLLTQNREIPDPPDADFLRDSINLSSVLQEMGITASSDGETLTIRSSTGVDLTVEVTGNGGDSIKLRDGDLRNIIGKADLSAGYDAPVNSSFDIDLGFGSTTVTLTPGSVNHIDVESALQADIDSALGAGVVRVTRSERGTIILEAMDPTRKINISNVSQDDLLGISPLVVSGPDLGDQPAILGGGIATIDPFDFTGVNGTFSLAVNGVFNDSIILNQNYSAGSGPAIVAAINTQITASIGPTGLAGIVRAELDTTGAIQFVSTDVGPDASISVTAAVGTQNVVINGTATGAQLTGTQATVTGAADVNAGVNFDINGPHDFMLAVDGNPPVQVTLIGQTGIPATFTNTVDISGGVNLTALPNSFELTVAGYPTAFIDVSGVDTTLAPTPFSSAPQGIVDLFQQQIDATLGPNIVTVGMNGSNQMTLTTVDAGLSTSITVSNPTGDVSTNVFPVTGTSVGSEQGGAGVVNIVRNAINTSLVAAGLDPVQVGINESGFLTILSSTHGETSQISITDVNGSYGMIFPGTDHGELFTSVATVGGSIDVQLAANTTLASSREDGLFGSEPEAIDNYTGYQIFLNSGLGGNGLPVTGDTFLIDFNTDGSTDNTNAHAMVALSNKQILSNGNLGLLSAYGQMVEEIGILTNQSRISQEASESLLRQSEAALQSVAGVNIDEEAANLIKFEQHYNASAQLISIARDLFDAILNL
ncbi:MAG: hypothetical protein GKR91_02560 [Pseudomonadales bacterium]|nr:hypothetical protein [Pseudomonadales bacterium]